MSEQLTGDKTVTPGPMVTEAGTSEPGTLHDSLLDHTLSDGLVADLVPLGGGGSPSWSTAYDASLGERPDGPKGGTTPKVSPSEDLVNGKYTSTGTDGSKLSLGTGKGTFTTSGGSSTTLSGKGVSHTQTGASGSKSTTGIGADGLTLGHTEQVQSPTGSTFESGYKSTIGPDGLSHTTTGNGSERTLTLGPQLGYSTSTDVTDSKTGATTQNKRFVGYDLESGDVSAGLTRGGKTGYVSVGDGGVTVGGGTRTMGGSVSFKADEHTLDVGASAYYKGIGAGGSYHSVEDKPSETTHDDHAILGDDVMEHTSTDEIGWSANAGIKVVQGGGWSNDTSTGSYLVSDDPERTDEEQAEIDERLGLQSQLGRDGLELDQLDNGQGLTFSENDTGGGEIGVNALGIARYSYGGWSSDVEGGGLYKQEDGTVVGSHTRGTGEGSQHDYGALWGVYSGKTSFSSGHEGTIDVQSDGTGDNDALMEQYAQDGYGSGGTVGVRAGQEVAPGLVVQGVSDVDSEGYENTQKGLWGLGKYERKTSDVTSSEEHLIDDGNGAIRTVDRVEQDQTGGHLLGVGGSSTTTTQTGGATAFVTDGSGNQEDFVRLQDMSDQGQEQLDLSQMKTSEQLSFSKYASVSEDDHQGTLGLESHDNNTTVSGNKTTDVIKVDGGTQVHNQASGQRSGSEDDEVLWGYTQSSSSSSQSGSKSVVVQGADGSTAVQDVAQTGQTDLELGQQLDDGTVVTQTSSSQQATSSDSSSLGWGLIEDSSYKTMSKEESGTLVDGGSQHEVKMGAGELKSDGDVTKGSKIAGTVKTGPDGNHLSMQYMQGASTGGAAVATLAKTELEPTDLKAISTRYNEGDDAAAFWGKLAREAALAVMKASPELAKLFYKVNSPEAFQKLTAPQQEAFVKGVLKDIDDSNPFEVIAVIELMGDEGDQAESYSAMMERIYREDEDGNGSLVAEKYAAFVGSQASVDMGLYKQLKGKANVTTRSG
jgi:hypothetical protein